MSKTKINVLWSDEVKKKQFSNNALSINKFWKKNNSSKLKVSKAFSKHEDSKVSDNKILKIKSPKIKVENFSYKQKSITIKNFQIKEHDSLTLHQIKINKELKVKVLGAKLNFESSKHKDKKYYQFVFLLPPIKLSSDKSLHKPLWKTQVTGIEFILSEKTVLIADDTGLGKTVQAVMSLRLLFRLGLIKKALVVVPKSTLGDIDSSHKTGEARQWAGHFELWAPELEVNMIEPAAWIDGIPPAGFSGSASIDRKLDWAKPSHVCLTTYALIRNDIKNGVIANNSFDAIILDEAHLIKNPFSQQSMMLRNLSAEYKVCLTGTPVQNAPKELYAIFQFLKPEIFPELKPQQLNELSASYIVDKTKPFYIRRNKLKDDLPPKTKHEIWIELNNAQRESYEYVYRQRVTRLKDILTNSDNQEIAKKSMLGTITALKQICNFDPNYISSNKPNEVINIIKTAKKNNEKILIFSRFLKFGIDPLISILDNYKTLQLVGGMSNEERNINIDKFKTSNDFNILICSIQAAGVGLNLAEASTVIHFDHWWNPAIMWQAEDRAHRFGQKREVNVYSLWCKNTIEERIFKVLKNKEKMIKNLMIEMGSEQATYEIDKMFTFDDWLDVFEI